MVSHVSPSSRIGSNGGDDFSKICTDQALVKLSRQKSRDVAHVNIQNGKKKYSKLPSKKG